MRLNIYVSAMLVVISLSGLAQSNNNSTLQVADNQEAEVAYNTGNNMLEMKNYSEAIKEYTKAIGYNPNFDKAYINRAICYTETKDYQKAFADYNFVVGLNNSASAYFGRGVTNYYLSDNKLAQEDFQKAKSIGYEEAALYYFLGAVSFELGNYTEAVEYYTLCLKKDPAHTNALNDRGSAYRMLAKYDEAIKDYNDAIKTNPNIDFLYNNLGSAYWKQGNLDDAIVNYGLAIRLNPKNVTALNNRATVKIEKGNFDEAIEDCNEALRIDPQYAFAYNNRGNAKIKNKDYDGAVTDFDSAINLNKNFGAAYLNRGICNEMRQKYEKAIADWQKAYDLGIKKAKNYIQFYD